ncbi:MAG: hypothetical protein HN757_04550, partial [Calditrichaeota bacterium]|nr:hypothetical protein [Calditrichota bacterium]
NEDNGYLVFGNISWQIGWPPENFTKILVLSLDANGDSLWTKFYGTDKRDYAHTVIGTDDGGYAIAGYTTSLDEGNEGYFGRDFFLLRLDENCDSLWMQAYQQPSTNECKKVIQTSVGGFALAGKTGYFRNNSTSYQIIFTDENGDSLWSYVAESDGFDDDRCYTINEIVGDEPDQSLYILSGVKTIGNAPFGDMWTMAINTEGVRQWERFDGSDEFRMNEDQ